MDTTQIWTVYILKCKNNYLYTGITTDLKKRFKAHREGKGAQFTARNKPTKILYTEEQPSQKDAMKREREIKKLPKKKKLDLCSNYG
jgi:putative endonuclease